MEQIFTIMKAMFLLDRPMHRRPRLTSLERSRYLLVMESVMKTIKDPYNMIFQTAVSLAVILIAIMMKL